MKERVNTNMPTLRQEVIDNPIPTSLFHSDRKAVKQVLEKEHQLRVTNTANKQTTQFHNWTRSAFSTPENSTK